jgi:hypothetical protein
MTEGGVGSEMKLLMFVCSNFVAHAAKSKLPSQTLVIPVQAGIPLTAITGPVVSGIPACARMTVCGECEQFKTKKAGVSSSLLDSLLLFTGHANFLIASSLISAARFETLNFDAISTLVI